MARYCRPAWTWSHDELMDSTWRSNVHAMPKSRSRKKAKSSRSPSKQQRLRQRGEPPPVAPGNRRPQLRIRPVWHRPAGIVLAALGAILIVVNYAEHMDIGWIPGGHKEAYFALGLIIAATGAWFLAAFDRPA